MLFVQKPQLYEPIIFRLTGRYTDFTRRGVFDILQEWRWAYSIITPKSYTGHSFWKKATQYASDNGMLDQFI